MRLITPCPLVQAPDPGETWAQRQADPALPGDLTLWKVGVIRGPEDEMWDDHPEWCGQNHITNLSHVLPREASGEAQGYQKWAL